MNAFVKKALAGLALVGAVTSAQAVTNTFTLDLSSGATNFGNTLTGTGYQFTDNYTFSLGSSYDFDGGLLSVATSKKIGNKTVTTSDLDITGLTLYGPNSYSVVGSQDSVGKTDVWTLSALNLLKGAYTLVVTGKVLGTTGGAYGGNINISAVSPVPEASTWAMMIAGLGFVGFVARRRKANGAMGAVAAA